MQSYFYLIYRGTVVSWLVHSTPGRVILDRALAGDIVLSSWKTIYSLSASYHPGVQMGTSKLNAGD